MGPAPAASAASAPAASEPAPEAWEPAQVCTPSRSPAARARPTQERTWSRRTCSLPSRGTTWRSSDAPRPPSSPGSTWPCAHRRRTSAARTELPCTHPASACPCHPARTGPRRCCSCTSASAPAPASAARTLWRSLPASACRTQRCTCSSPGRCTCRARTRSRTPAASAWKRPSCQRCTGPSRRHRRTSLARGARTSWRSSSSSAGRTQRCTSSSSGRCTCRARTRPRTSSA